MFPICEATDELLISGGNPPHTWQKWKRKFDIYLQATRALSKSDAIKVGLLLNHVTERCLEVYTNFTYLPELPVPYPKQLVNTIVAENKILDNWTENYIIHQYVQGKG